MKSNSSLLSWVWDFAKQTTRKEEATMPGYKKLGRTSDQRKAILRGLVTDLLRNERITTTQMRAKEAGRRAEKMITLAKRGDLHARRQVLAYVYDEAVVTKLFDEIAPRYEDRNGGYTRILKLGPRRGDAAEEVFLELV
jgi:large subunit ribosomal protein L17